MTAFFTDGPGRPLPPGTPGQEAAFDRAMALTPEQAGHWAWAALTGLLEAPSVPRGISEWVWSLPMAMGGRAFLQAVEGAITVRDDGDFDVVVRDLVLSLARAMPVYEVGLRNMAAAAERMEAPTHNVEDLTRRLYDQQATLLIQAGDLPVWIQR